MSGNLRLLGLDHGIRRIGVALSDPSGLVARELCIIARQSKQEDFARLNALAREHEARAFVVGVPHHDTPSGVHAQADTVRLWISRLAETTALPIIEWDEQLTSEDAKQLARYLRRPAQAPIDDLAARLILQSYLDALRDGLATFPLRGAPPTL
ncbi:MAG: Holliday junction resolvase RuvX [Anaerolineae bacterium]|nr:Holliday junction resolvase RuvX [Anaerolineae bacterium]MDW8173219.1 Holliday junction resolvase RuvX [Anaerolineae bacterium]